MATPLTVKTTAQGILIPRAVFQDWGEVEVLLEKDRIVIQPKSPLPVQEHEKWRQSLLTIPAWSEEEILEIEQAREYINQWQPRELF